jgi:uncharacterized protein (TIGR02679 family)
MEDPRRAAHIARLSRPALARLWALARARVEADPAGWSSRTVSVSDPSDEEREELRALSGRVSRGRRTTVDLGALDALLRSGPLGLSLPEWLAALGGALRDRPADAAARQARLDAAEARLQQCRHARAPWFTAWSAALGPTLRRLDTQKQLRAVYLAVAVLDRLPAPGLPRMQLAVEATGDPKALEGGHVATLVLSALAAWQEAEAPSDAETTRALWEATDVLADDLASRVRVIGLRPGGDGALAAWLREAADRGHPVVLTRRDVDLLGGWPPVPVFMCENPSLVLAAAHQLGPACPALVCAEGRPHAAFWRLVAQLAAAGCALRYHGDLDPVGVDIATQVLRRTGAAPWRMGLEDYEPLVRRDAPTWSSRISPRTPWCPALARRMDELRLPVFEEQMMAGLLEDLGVG